MVAALALSTAALPAPLGAQPIDPAVAPVDAFYDALLDAMRHAEEIKVQGRYDRLQPTMMKSFDVPVMVRAAVGGAFNTLSALDQANLRSAFGKLLVATFASTFDGYKGEKFVVDPAATERNKDKIVNTQFVGSGAPVDINYLVHDDGKGWRIIDVYLNGTISQLATWRAQYGSLLSNGGAPALVRAVDRQTAKFMAAI